MTNIHHHRLISLEIVGGFLDGQTFHFSDGLNCIIGARGTGKTTVLEFIRWVMDAIPEDEESCERINNLIEHNLDGGRVDLLVQTKDGVKYTVSRSFGEDPTVLDAKGKPTAIVVKNGGLFRLDVFSQNQVEDIADRTTSQLDLIDTFEAEEIGVFGSTIDEVRTDLVASAGQIIPLQEQIAALTERIKMLPTVTEKLKGFGTEGGQDAEKINKAHEAKAIRGREAIAVTTVMQSIDMVGRAIAEQVGVITDKTRDLFTDEMLEGPNRDIFQALHTSIGLCNSVVETHLTTALARLRQERKALNDGGAKLELSHKAQEVIYHQLLEKHKEIQGKASERAKLEKERNELLAKQRQLHDLTNKLNKLLDQRTLLKERLSETRDKRFSLRGKIVKEINRALAPSIKVSLEQYGSPQAYRELLENHLQGIGVKYNVVIPKLLDHFSPSDLSTVVAAGDPGPLVEKAGLNSAQAIKVIERLGGDGLAFELEVVELLDLPKIELNDNGTMKQTKVLSTGQKCTTILPILLLDSDSPLLIDQPEDNLDNRFVFDAIVGSIRKVKSKRQLIFVTHNPNIPVLGEADRIFVLESNGIAATKSCHGSVDECKKDIVTLLEGGEEAFVQRKNRYHY